MAGELLGALHGCAVAAYNVYFDIKFLAFELQHAGIQHQPPHFCLMYLRPMLGLGTRCKLDEACRIHCIEHQGKHVAAHDAMASALLYRQYLEVAHRRGIRTFGDLARLKRYKFVSSFANTPFPHPSALQLAASGQLCSRIGHIHTAAGALMRQAFATLGHVERGG